MTNSPDSAFAGTYHTIFLDRDGVVNEKMPEGSYVKSWDEFRLLPGVPEAIARLNRAGLRVIVVSNQRGVALGLYSSADIEAIHAKLQDALKKSGAHVDAFYFCPHDKNACKCRKPLPGMFEDAAKDNPAICAADSIMIGDSFSDIEFGRRLGMGTVLIQGDPANQKKGNHLASELADHKYPSLYAAVEDLLASNI